MKKLLVLFGWLVLTLQLLSQVPPDEALQKLRDGNKRFQAVELSDKNYQSEIEATAEGQSPYAIIVACSDSRVPPEIIFDESIGNLFVIRLAGNVVDSAAIGSIEYAVKYLHSSYLLVLGHTSCGAVTAAVSGKDYSPSINLIAKMINPALEAVIATDVGEDKILTETIEKNVYVQADNAFQKSDIISTHMNDGSLKIGGAVYDISTGAVHFLHNQ